ncbi:MAG: TIGR04083 family peptide-modifying radical SAM enzyme [Methanocalculus sp.]|uniref:TIGR04083 family peptide-modifying radical SAM enzyme n=1 Tax=Methanocalculus sp. TaxID=2004547 RepID=UPI00271806F4|nr:TIGR04083 family peptide-modifying radical SAM enzyme [Methanocalculus sp.]MDO9539398.1 TIGR04083 family peptide-modifying radical SAM enzyme [Methanocalculus sp.]
MKNPFHVMIIPTLGCCSNCAYCWSSEEGSPIMTIDTIHDIVRWLKDFRSDPVTFTFHGGEPLLAGADFYRQALPILSEGLSHLTPEFALQSNLWKMTPEVAEALAAYHIPIGSSIDGPEAINDTQRGTRYYEKTMRGYEIARSHGLSVRFICTFTNKSVLHKEDIFNYFMDKGFPMKLHPALPSLRDGSPEEWALPPEEYGELLIYLLDKYLENLDKSEVMNINDLVKCVVTRHGTVCTYVDCMANTFAIGPDGAIYPCYRFVGMPEFVMGNVASSPSPDELAESKPWRLMQEYKQYVDSACADCSHINYCRGGCPYNAIARTEGRIEGVDPHCPAYKRIFEEINDRLNREMFETSSVSARRKRRTQPGIMALMQRILAK